MVDQQGYEEVMQGALMVKSAMDNKDYQKAFDTWATTEQIIQKVAHNVDFYNVLTPTTLNFKSDCKKIYWCFSIQCFTAHCFRSQFHKAVSR